MKKLFLIVRIENENYDFKSGGSYLELLGQARKICSGIDQVLIDVGERLAYCYCSNDDIENLTA